MKLTLNLASRSYVNRRALYAAYAATIVALLLLGGFNLTRAWRLNVQAGQIETRLAELEARAGAVRGASGGAITPAALEQQRAAIGFANEILLRDSFRWTSLLDRLEAVAVEGVSIRALQPNFKNQALRLTGHARSIKELREFIDRLIAAPGFSEVYLLQQSNEKVKTPAGAERPAVSFSLALKGVF